MRDPTSQLNLFHSQAVYDNPSSAPPAISFAKSRPGSRLSVVSAYFTIYAYDALKDQLDSHRPPGFPLRRAALHQVARSRARPRRSRSSSTTTACNWPTACSRSASRKECADWIRDKVDIRSVTQIEPAPRQDVPRRHGRRGGRHPRQLQFHRARPRPRRGQQQHRAEPEVDSNRDRRDLKALVRRDLERRQALVEDVKATSRVPRAALPEPRPRVHLLQDPLPHLRGLPGRPGQGRPARPEHQDRRHRDLEGAVRVPEGRRQGRHQQDPASTTAASWPTASAWARPTRRWPSSSTSNCGTSASSCSARRSCARTGPSTRRRTTAPSTRFIGDRFRYNVLSHTDLSRERGKSGDIDLATLNWGNYDLVVIDESHNFRNNTPGRRDEDGQHHPQEPLPAADGRHHPDRCQDQGASALRHAGQQRPERPAQPDLLHHRRPATMRSRTPSASPASRKPCAVAQTHLHRLGQASTRRAQDQRPAGASSTPPSSSCWTNSPSPAPASTSRRYYTQQHRPARRLPRAPEARLHLPGDRPPAPVPVLRQAERRDRRLQALPVQPLASTSKPKYKTGVPDAPAATPSPRPTARRSSSA